MGNPLVEYEKNAFLARRSKNFQVAISLYEKIVMENPNWEHGQAFYDLAGCYEDIGDLKKAEENYLRALSIQPDYYIFVGGYASFVYRIGEPQIAFNWYLKLLILENENHDLERMRQAKQVLLGLGDKMGLEAAQVELQIAQSLDSLSKATTNRKI